MLEEKNDNLPQADGELNEIQSTEIQTEATDNHEEIIADAAVELVDAAETPAETELEVTEVPTEVAELEQADETGTEVVAEVVELEEAVETVESPAEEIATPEVSTEHDSVIEEIANANAEASEDESIRAEIPMQDYDTMTLEELVDNLESLVDTDAVLAVKDHVEELKNHS